MPVESQHEEYADNLSNWQVTRDCDKGSKAIKSRSKGSGSSTGTLNGLSGTAYLPAPNAEDSSSKNEQRYYAYRDRANFVNFVSSTKEGFTGLIFRRKTEIEAPAATQYLIDNINGDGLTTDQMIKEVTNNTLLVGRHGLLTEYPTAESGLTEAQVTAQNLRANIVSYPAESIINWRSETTDGITKLSMVVLREPREVTTDGFKYDKKIYHRVLRLVDGVYIQNVYDDSGRLVTWSTGEGDGVTGDIIPKKSNGDTWDNIPFTFIGSVNNDACVDKAPLYDIAEINIGHYHNSADYEESCFMVGQPTPVITGLTASWVKDVLDGKIGLGSRGAIMLPVGGAADLMQAAPNQMPLEGMNKKEAQLLQIGARLIQDTNGNERTDAVKGRLAGQGSKLASIILNVESAFIQCFGWAGEFMGVDNGEIIVKINKEFYDETLDPQMVMSQIALMDRGVIAKTDLRSNLRSGGLVDPDRTDDDIDGEAEETTPLI